MVEFECNNLMWKWDKAYMTWLLHNPNWDYCWELDIELKVTWRMGFSLDMQKLLDYPCVNIWTPVDSNQHAVTQLFIKPFFLQYPTILTSCRILFQLNENSGTRSFPLSQTSTIQDISYPKYWIWQDHWKAQKWMMCQRAWSFLSNHLPDTCNYDCVLTMAPFKSTQQLFCSKYLFPIHCS